MAENSDYKLYFTTVQSNAIRILIESLKDVLTDVNIHINSSLIKVVSMDASRTAIVYLKLLASQFEKFTCESPIVLGVNMLSLFKIIKSIKNNDIITFYVLNDMNDLYIQIDNHDKNIQVVSKLRLLDIDENIINIPNLQFDTVLTIPSSDFQNYVRDLSVISNEIKIVTKNNSLVLEVDGDFASQSIKISQQNNGLVVSQCKDTSNTFNLKYLLLFTKSSNLCNTIELCLMNNFPLILLYNVANLGQLKFCLAPKQST